MINQHKIENILHAVDVALDKTSLENDTKVAVINEVSKTLKTINKVEICKQLRKEKDFKLTHSFGTLKDMGGLE